jgi:ABC-2 type transport system permease protein
MTAIPPAPAAGRQGQLRLVGWLRWRLFVNGLRTRRGKADLASKIILGVVIGAVLLGAGPLLGLGAWYAIHNSQPYVLPGELWGIFFFWLMLPIFVSGFGAESDPGSLLRFPLRYSAFVFLALAHGLFDPISVAACYWLLAMLTGIAVASPGAALRAIPALGLFAIFNVLLNRVIFAWLSHWLAKRRTREILGLVFLLVMFSFQLCGPLSERYGKTAMPALIRLVTFGRFFPAGLAASTIMRGHAGGAGDALAGGAGLVAFCALFGWILFLRLRAEYRGESVSEARAEKSAAPADVRAGFTVAGLSPTVAALLEKDVKYLVRNTSVFFSLAVPFVLVIVMTLSRGGAHDTTPSFMRSGATLFPMSVGYVMLVLLGFAYNVFGYDGEGMSVLFAAPVRFRDVVLSKNLLHALMVSAEVLLITVLDWIVVGPVSVPLLLVTFLGAAGVVTVNLALGDLMSFYFPRKLKFGQMRRQQNSGLSILVSLGTQIVLFGLAIGLYLMSHVTGSLAWCWIGFLVLDVLALVAYRQVMAAVDGIALKRRDALIIELCR